MRSKRRINWKLMRCLLATNEFVVETLFRPELVMGARFHDTSFVNYSYAVCVLNRRQPVCDDDARSANSCLF